MHLRTKADQQLAAQGNYIGWPKGLDAETVELPSISLSSLKRYRNHAQAVLA